MTTRTDPHARSQTPAGARHTSPPRHRLAILATLTALLLAACQGLPAEAPVVTSGITLPPVAQAQSGTARVSVGFRRPGQGYQLTQLPPYTEADVDFLRAELSATGITPVVLEPIVRRDGTFQFVLTQLAPGREYQLTIVAKRYVFDSSEVIGQGVTSFTMANGLAEEELPLSVGVQLLDRPLAVQAPLGITISPGAIASPPAAEIAFTPSVGNVDTLAGDASGGYQDGPGTAAQFYGPQGVAVDLAGQIYVADSGNNRIRKITPAGLVSTVAGNGSQDYVDGPGASAAFANPTAIAVDTLGRVYVADSVNHRIRTISPGGVVSTLAGDGIAGFADGTGTAAQFNSPEGIAVDHDGNVYVADRNNHRIRKITPAGLVSTVAGDGTPSIINGTISGSRFDQPAGVAVDAAGNLYVSESLNSRVRKITPTGDVTTLAGSGAAGFANGSGTTAQFNIVGALAVDARGTVYVADIDNHRIRAIAPDGMVSTLAGNGTNAFGDGTGTTAQFNGPTGVAVSATGTVYVADTANNRIRRIQ